MKTKSWLRRTLIALGVGVGLILLGTAILVVVGLRDNIGRADVGLVLGSKVELNGEPSERLRARLDKAMELYGAGMFPKIIVSGGTGEEGFDEAAVMRDYLVAKGIARKDIITDSSGTTTFATARNALQLSRDHHFKSVLIISQYFHVPRSCMALRRFGLAPVYSAHANFFEWRDIYSSFRELFAYLTYLTRRYDS